MRVLVIKVGAIGDVIMSLTMISALRVLHPDTHLTWVVGKTSQPILDWIEGVDTTIVVDEQRLLAGRFDSRLRETLRLWRALAGKSFDLVVTGHSDPRYRLLSAPVRTRARRSFARGTRAGPLPGRYHGDEYARLISDLDGPATLRYELPRIVRPLPAPPLERDGKAPIVVLAPGGARNVLRDDALRRWPLESYVELARTLIRSGYRVLLTGAADEKALADGFSSLPVTDLIGRTSLPELAAIFQSARVVVTHDSLALHLARLVRTAAVALFGPTSPWDKVPDETQVRVLWGGAALPCRPCYDGVNYFSCPSNICMRTISADQVARAVCELASGLPASAPADPAIRTDCDVTITAS